MLLHVVLAPMHLFGCHEFGVDYDVSNTIQTVPDISSPSQCESFCNMTSTCFAWTWSNQSFCELKRDIYGRAPDRYWPMVSSFPDLPNTKKGYVSGPKKCPESSPYFTREELIEEVIGLSSCKFDGLVQAKEILSSCGLYSSKRNSDFSHWQVSHSSSRYKKTYPRKQWEDCTVEGRFCRCSTSVRFGAKDWWSQPTVVEGGSRKCTENNFKFLPGLKSHRPAGRRRCQCLTSPQEMDSSAGKAFLSMPIGDSKTTDESCQLHASVLSKKINSLSRGWGETVPHILLGLTSHCLDLPKWVSIASWKQDVKTFRLPCESLTAFDFNSVTNDNTGLYYTQRINHWRWMPMNMSVGVQEAVFELFNVRIPEKLIGGPIGNPEIKMWGKLGWSHPCCQYQVVTQVAQSAYAKFLLLISLHMSDAISYDSAAASAACFRWLHPSVGCTPRYFGYLTEALFILFTYLTQNLIPLLPGSQGSECVGNMISNHTLHGSITHAQIEQVFAEKFAAKEKAMQKQ
eukprot:TRINITY_DN10223_c0_g1_i1.p1 TRINITY_DN10223_c0_g1~~TRINITY_DN10223_c0_g1_i1.p1  ORF type:complete len:514 (+),score=59.27 TRINITY_DN10223_c0_g1_i1:3-1544(+)